MNAVVDRAHVLDAQPPGDDQPHRDEETVDGRRPAQPEPEAGNHAEALRRQPEEERAAAVGDPIDHDVNRVLHRDALRRRNREIEELVAGLVD